jgi:hypothetical protein
MFNHTTDTRLVSRFHKEQLIATTNIEVGQASESKPYITVSTFHVIQSEKKTVRHEVQSHNSITYGSTHHNIFDLTKSPTIQGRPLHCTVPVCS